MSVIEFHPDDLLDREIKGTLSQLESRRLRDHVDRCMQCRLERQLRRDFEEELGSRDEPKTVQSFVTGALRAVGVRRASRSSVWKRRLVYLLAASIVFAAGLAAADTEMAGRAWSATRETLAFVFGSTAPHPSRDVETARAPATTPQPENLAAPIVAPSPQYAFEKDDSAGLTPPVEMPSVDVPSVEVPAPSHPRTPGAGAPAGTLRHRLSKNSPHVAEQVPIDPFSLLEEAQTRTKLDASPSSLLDRAGTARRKGNLLEAAALYRDLQARFPASPEARLSLAIVARMQLDLGQPASAVSGFDAYLDAGERALREEAMAGRAIALGRLGRTADEVEGWRALLRAYPSSGYAHLARKRLGQDFP